MSDAPAKGGILIVDFGTQYCQLIARRVREMGVYSRITVPDRAATMLAAMQPDGVILSGGPRSVYENGAPTLDPSILEQGIPVLGICYGMQWMTHVLGGVVQQSADGGEYGRATIERRAVSAEAGALFDGVSESSVVWMSHGDRIDAMPEDFELLAESGPCPIAAAASPQRRIYGLQFHPEVTHSVEGGRILQNFVTGIAGCAADWKPGDIVDRKIAAVRELVGDEGEVVLGLSGGVDSSVAAVLIHRAIGDRLHCVFVDNGLLREGEREGVESLFRDEYRMDVHVVDASERFLKQLAGVEDPEVKRKRIGYEFVEVFRECAKGYRSAGFLGQGTLYPDVIESVAAHGGATATIKSHHNVGGLPEDLEMKLVEPLRDLFKDEVRALGRELGLPPSLVDRQPFPGPGLAVRCLGEVQAERLEPLRAADAIVRQEVESRGLQVDLWQYFAVLLPVKSVGVMGDQRTYESACVVRIVSSDDAMTADWELLPTEVLRTVSNRVINEVSGINRVCLDISSKPPATIEWE